MSPLARRLRVAVLAAALLALAAGCSKKHGASPFDPESGHADDFFGSHPAAYRANSGSCVACHGADLQGGVSTVSCYSASRDGRSCHPGGPGGGHPVGWAKSSSHGIVAKGTPGPSSGLAACSSCHGTDFAGGSAGLACFSCHGVRAPHPAKPWRGNLTHTSTGPGNAPICAQCHRSRGGDPGCFNTTLCHGQRAGHKSGWSAPGLHGAAAKDAPGSSSGMGSCEACHGVNFQGGSGPACSDCHGLDAPHPREGWQAGGPSHRTTNQGNADVCAQCHRRSVGPAGCFNGTLCHAQGAGHPANWEDAGQHGFAAKSAPSGSAGFSYCERCHGTNYAGGSSGQSCSPCHGWNAPHGSSWNNGGTNHRTTDGGNAEACARCHRSNSGTAGCFNNTLCHGRGGGHPAGWDAASAHGAAARSDLASCQVCHGSNYAGGTSGQSCFPCHGWPAGDDSAHGRSGWDGGGSRHRVNQSNAGACAVCHREQAGTPGCFNNTLCHGD